MDYSKHQEVISALEKAMEADHDNRERARECQQFLAARDGQWEPEWAERAKDKPRYTFDMCEAIVDQILGDIEQSDFEVSVIPTGGESSEDIADTYKGLIRSIKASSNAKGIFRRADRSAVISGFDAVRVIQKYCSGESFDQDLAIEAIPNAIDRVWFGYHTEPDASDAKHCWILSSIEKAEYEERFPDAPETSLNDDRQTPAFFNKHELVTVGEFLYLKPEKVTLVKMNNGSVFTLDDDFQAMADEMEMAGIVEEKRRDTTVMKVYSRRFSADGWLDKSPRETVFKHHLPVVPLYGTFEVIDDKLVYRGVIEKIMDPQRVLNYSLSREIEEGALAPRAKYWMTRTQAEGEAKSLATLNTNTEPVQFYTPDPEAPGVPQQQGGAVINPGLRNISQAMQEIISISAGMFAANMGDNPGLQSGVAIESLQDRGDRANNKFLQARETFERQLCKILIQAIPEVYEPSRQIRLLGQDGAVEIVTIGELVQDTQTGRTMVLHDLSKGSYDVMCTASPSFRTRQSETVKAITDIAQADPSIIELGGDILLSNIPAPGMDELAARKRAQLFQAGLIPQEQMTQEELQIYQQMQNQPPQESPEMVLARAEQAKADAEAQKAQADFMAEQNKSQQIQINAQVEAQKLANESARIRLDAFKAETDAKIAGLQSRKIYADIVKTLAEAEKIEADTDTTVSRIDEAFRGMGAA